MKVGRTDAGRVDGQGAHRPPHRLRRGDVARCSASSASPASTASTSCSTPRRCSPARRAAGAADGVCVYAISGGTGAHMADLAAAAGLTLPDAHRGDAAARCTSGSRRTCACRTRSTTAARPSADWRGRKILDAIVADPNVDVLDLPDHRRAAIDERAAGRRTSSTWRRPPTSRSASSGARRSATRTPTARSCSASRRARRSARSPTASRGARRTSTTTRSARATVAVRQARAPAAARRRPRRELCSPRGAALSEHESKQVLAAYGIPVTRDVLVDVRRQQAVRAAEAIGFPVVHEGVRRPTCSHKSDRGLVRVGVGVAEEVRADVRRPCMRAGARRRRRARVRAGHGRGRDGGRRRATTSCSARS